MLIHFAAEPAPPPAPLFEWRTHDGMVFQFDEADAAANVVHLGPLERLGPVVPPMGRNERRQAALTAASASVKVKARA